MMAYTNIPFFDDTTHHDSKLSTLPYRTGRVWELSGSNRIRFPVEKANEIYLYSPRNEFLKAFNISGDSCEVGERCKFSPNEIMVNISPGTIILQLQSEFAKLKYLPRDWNGMGSDPPNFTAISNAFTVINLSQEISFLPTQISPSAENGVAISFVKKNRYAIIECYNEGEIVAAIFDEQNILNVREYDASEVDIKEMLDQIEFGLNE